MYIALLRTARGKVLHIRMSALCYFIYVRAGARVCGYYPAGVSGQCAMMQRSSNGCGESFLFIGSVGGGAVIGT